VDLLITTDEDARLVFGLGAESANAPVEEARTLKQRFGISAVAITLSENPLAAVVAADGQDHTVPRYEIEAVDRIGAGDAFSGGLIVSRLENRGWDDAVRFATAMAALKHSIPGDFCLVTRDEVDQLLRGTSRRVSR
jgi:2-dehydro-3-deoxygluconokinase